MKQREPTAEEAMHILRSIRPHDTSCSVPTPVAQAVQWAVRELETLRAQLDAVKPTTPKLRTEPRMPLDCIGPDEC